jgi:hypothetical protein
LFFFCFIFLGSCIGAPTKIYTVLGLNTKKTFAWSGFCFTSQACRRDDAAYFLHNSRIHVAVSGICHASQAANMTSPENIQAMKSIAQPFFLPDALWALPPQHFLTPVRHKSTPPEESWRVGLIVIVRKKTAGSGTLYTAA